jgi:hypothetical protein
MSDQGRLLLEVLREPARLPALGLADWELLVRLARHANLLGRLVVLVEAGMGLDAVPEAPRRHLRSARYLMEKQERSVRWEAQCIRAALEPTGIPVVFLKGTAYLLAGLPAAHGRIFSDVDILVPRADIERAEQALMIAGWHGGHHNAYDQRYYRQWMHEIPPLRHIHRQAIIDVHHNILPLTARFHPDAEALLRARVALPGGWGAVLAPVDLVLHSATHLFHEGEFQQGLRDLVDLSLLIGHYREREAFWEELLERARELQLSRPLYYALRHTRRMLGLPVPAAVEDALRREGPGALRGRYMDWLFTRSFLSREALRPRADESLARLLLYIRGHYLRMPPSLLAAHLARKAFAREEG